jgi:hypothetical protein
MEGAGSPMGTDESMSTEITNVFKTLDVSVDGARGPTHFAGTCPTCKAPMRGRIPPWKQNIEFNCENCGGKFTATRRNPLQEQLLREAMGIYACNACGGPMPTMHHLDGRNLCASCAETASEMSTAAETITEVRDPVGAFVFDGAQPPDGDGLFLSDGRTGDGAFVFDGVGAREMKGTEMYEFEPRRYSSIKKFAFIRVLDGERLAAIVRPPMGGLRGEHPDHWRVDCGEADYDPVANTRLKKLVSDFVGTNQVSVFWPWNGWNDQNNTEPYPPGEDWRSSM